MTLTPRRQRPAWIRIRRFAVDLAVSSDLLLAEARDLVLRVRDWAASDNGHLQISA